MTSYTYYYTILYSSSGSKLHLFTWGHDLVSVETKQ
jgi:hypothetical protein